MASKVGNAFTTYFATGNREDLSNAIYNIDPFDTPLMSAIRRRNVKNRIFDWQTENLPITAPPAPDPAANAQVEGFLLVNKPAQPTIRQSNVTQISERDATVTGSQEESDAAGKGSEMAHQMAMTSKVLKSDIEVALCSRQPRQDGSDNGTTQTARVTEGFSHWLGRARSRPTTANSQRSMPGGAVCARHRHHRAPGRCPCGVPGSRRSCPTDRRNVGGRDATRVHQRGVTELVDRAARAEAHRLDVRRALYFPSLGWKDRSCEHGRRYCDRLWSREVHSFALATA